MHTYTKTRVDGNEQTDYVSVVKQKEPKTNDKLKARMNTGCVKRWTFEQSWHILHTYQLRDIDSLILFK